MTRKKTEGLKSAGISGVLNDRLESANSEAIENGMPRRTKCSWL